MYTKTQHNKKTQHKGTPEAQLALLLGNRLRTYNANTLITAPLQGTKEQEGGESPRHDPSSLLITPSLPVSPVLSSVNQRNICRIVKMQKQEGTFRPLSAATALHKTELLAVSQAVSLELLLLWAKTLPPGLRKPILINAFDFVRLFR